MQWHRVSRSSTRFSDMALGFACGSKTFMVTMYTHLSRSGEMADAADSKSAGAHTPCRFDSDLRQFFQKFKAQVHGPRLINSDRWETVLDYQWSHFYLIQKLKKCGPRSGRMC